MYIRNPSIYRKHYASGLTTSHIHQSGPKRLPERDSYGPHLQGHPDFIGPRTRMHQALFDMQQHFEKMRGGE